MLGDLTVEGIQDLRENECEQTCLLSLQGACSSAWCIATPFDNFQDSLSSVRTDFTSLIEHTGDCCITDPTGTGNFPNSSHGCSSETITEYSTTKKVDQIKSQKTGSKRLNLHITNDISLLQHFSPLISTPYTIILVGFLSFLR